MKFDLKFDLKSLLIIPSLMLLTACAASFKPEDIELYRDKSIRPIKPLKGKIEIGESPRGWRWENEFYVSNYLKEIGFTEDPNGPIYQFNFYTCAPTVEFPA